MVEYQIRNYAYDKGISRISTEGNDFNNCEDMLDNLRELLAYKVRKSSIDSRKRSVLNLRKRS